MDEQIRICRTCGLDKPLSQFRPKGPGKFVDGLTARCETCRTESRVLKAKEEATKKANIAVLRTRYAAELNAMKHRIAYGHALKLKEESNVCMVDQRVVGYVLPIIKQMRVP